MSGTGCIFCKIARREVPAKVVFENDRLVAFEDLRPQARVHVLVIPKRHIERVSDLEAADADLIGGLVLAAKDIAVKSGLKESGYRIVMNCNKDAGQEVFHIHLHLLGGRMFSWPPG